MLWFLALGLCGADSPAAAADFRVQDFRGAWHALADAKDRKAVVLAFLGVECPVARQYAPRLAELAKQYEAQGVAFFALDPNDQDGPVALGHFAKEHGLTFPLAKDVGNALADRFGVERVPTVVALDGDRKIAYRGRIDDQYGIGYQRPKPTARYLADALDAILAAKPVAVANTEPVGCRIGRLRKADSAAAVTFSKDVAPIFNRRCVECHRAGEIGPFALTGPKAARGWAEMILEVVEDGRMPPWHANPKHGAFKNDARLAEAEKDTIRQWVKAGAPEGNPADLPPAPTFAAGWRIPTPDAVVKMPKPHKVPATGEVEYQYFEMPTGFAEDKWIAAAEARPGNRSVVHHIIVFVKPPPGRGNTAVPGAESEWLTATAPGAMPLRLEPGHAKFIPKGATLVFQVHYTPNGSAQTDLSSVGLVFADPKTVRREVLTGRSATQKFALQPGAANQKVEADHRFAEDAILYAMFPHMHLRGRAFRYEAVYPDGKRETLLDVPRYDFAWQIGYILQEPKLLPAGTVMHCTARYDNSSANLSNPNPDATVKWGDQTWEEMMIGYFDMALAEQDLTQSRVDKFKALAAAGKLALPAPALAAARQAGDGALDDLATALKPVLPQLDRIDVLEPAGDLLKIAAATRRGTPRWLARLPNIPRVNAMPQLGRLGEKGDLGPMLDARKLVVRNHLTDLPGWDSKFLARMFGSAVHVPCQRHGAPALMSFYSRDPAAFPPAAVALLEQVAAAAQENAK